MSDHIFFIPVGRQSWTHFFKISNDLNSISWDNCITVPNSVDFDQTAHIKEQSDLCLHPFLRPINPFGIFFDL